VETVRAVGQELASERGQSLSEAARDVLSRSGEERPREGDAIPDGIEP
jgi:hypothetical protein